MNNQLKFDPNSNILLLPAKILFDIRNVLDQGNEHRNWRAFYATVANKYQISPAKVENFAMEIHKAKGSPSEKMLSHLASMEFKVFELVESLDILKLERPLDKLKNYVPIQLVSMPDTDEIVSVGESLEMKVAATGFPYPRYQWYKNDMPITAATNYVFTLSNIQCNDAGVYCCQVYNSCNHSRNKFTDETTVTVKPGSIDDYNIKEDCTKHPPKDDYNIMEDCTKHPPKGNYLPIILSHPQSLRVYEGQMFRLNCAVRGHPEMVYQWYKNGRPIESEKPYYQVEYSSVMDEGQYYCKVSNPFGTVKSSPANISVQNGRYPPFDPNIVPSSLDIIRNPQSSVVDIGGAAMFICEVRGRPPITYQWFHDGREIEGENSQELHIKNVSWSHTGMYQCCIENGQMRYLSTGAMLKTSIDPMNPGSMEFTAKDKIALLIGNYDYRAESALKAPSKDVQVLSEVFTSMNYKVVSLLNLTLTEMMSAVYEFCQLLSQGVYGVFYFCGHGFEESGQCYLVPWDAPNGFTTKECLCAQQVLLQMQERDPHLACMVLDVCRKKCKIQVREKPPIFEPKGVGNSLLCYATTIGMSAYEDEHNGILVKHLLPFIRDHRCIEDIFKDMREALAAEKIYQAPEIKTNLKEPRRSLADKISFAGSTQIFEKATRRWQEAHELPQTQEVVITNPNVVIGLNFSSDFSNVLTVHCVVKRLDPAAECYAYIAQLPAHLSLSRPTEIMRRNPPETRSILQDIQKLQEPLKVIVALQYKAPGTCTWTNINNVAEFDLGRPLVSKLDLWNMKSTYLPPSNRLAAEGNSGI